MNPLTVDRDLAVVVLNDIIRVSVVNPNVRESIENCYICRAGQRYKQ